MMPKLDDMLTPDCDLKQWITSEGFMWVPMPNTPPELLEDVEELCFVLNSIT